MGSTPENVGLVNATGNQLCREDRPAHGWYRFVLSFPPQLVRSCLDRLEVEPGQTVLDPFCGTGTTLVECKKQGIASVGFESNPIARFASHVKVDWTPPPDSLVRHASGVAQAAEAELVSQGVVDNPVFEQPRPTGLALRQLPPERARLLIKDSMSPLPLHKTLVLLDHLRANESPRYTDHEMLALASALVDTIGNLHFGPEVGVGKIKTDSPVVAPWLSGVKAMARDLRGLGSQAGVPSEVHLADAREPAVILEPQSIDAVITSPPYPNEKDYTRTTRLESVLLGFVRSRSELRGLKGGLLRSNTRGVYKADDDDAWVEDQPEVQRIADAIEARRIELGKTSGFERQYHRVARLYFGGMARHFAGLRHVLKPGARLAYVVGDQASFLRVLIRTGKILADIAASLGYEVLDIDLFRTRLATATKEYLREEVVLLRWPE